MPPSRPSREGPSVGPTKFSTPGWTPSGDSGFSRRMVTSARREEMSLWGEEATMSLFLQVSITVPSNQEMDFSNQLKVVLGDQAFADWKLEGGLKVTQELDPAGFDGSPSRRLPGETEFINVWRLPEGATSTDVAAKMVRLSETESYVALDAKVHTEVQEIVYLISGPRAPNAWDVIRDSPKAKPGAIARVRYYPFRTNISSL